jgi:hypothetical protein
MACAKNTNVVQPLVAHVGSAKHAAAKTVIYKNK